MNIELVYIILLGVSSCMEFRKRSDRVEPDLLASNNTGRRQTTAVKIEETKHDTKVTFEGFKLKDIDKWNVDA